MSNGSKARDASRCVSCSTRTLTCRKESASREELRLETSSPDQSLFITCRASPESCSDESERRDEGRRSTRSLDVRAQLSHNIMMMRCCDVT